MDLLPLPEAIAYRGPLGKPYHPHPDLIGAANAALVLATPLLLTGEPGCGKTHFAWAAAYALGLPGPLQCYVRSDSRARDFLYSYDALRRFSDAQSGDRERVRDVRHYVELQPLGQALIAPQRQVVLIDEIDKAPRDLPNDLLRELDQGRFEIPEIPREVPEGSDGALRRQMGGGARPFVVITSNVERQLPDAFLRRCVFYHIPFPDAAALRRILVDHFQGEAPVGPLIDAALGVFQVLREFKPRLQKRPATAELIGWVQALRRSDPSGAAVRRVETLWQELQADDKAARRPGLWAGLPLLGCLVKQREDMERVVGKAG